MAADGNFKWLHAPNYPFLATDIAKGFSWDKKRFVAKNFLPSNETNLSDVPCAYIFYTDTTKFTNVLENVIFSKRYSYFSFI